MAGRISFERLNLADRDATAELFARGPWQAVLHFAARPRSRYSQENPSAYVDSNLVALANVLEGCRHAEIGHFVFASSSSVYGANRRVPFAVHNAGRVRRDFTYVDDMVEEALRILTRPPRPGEVRPFGLRTAPRDTRPDACVQSGSRCPEPGLAGARPAGTATSVVRHDVPLPRCELPKTFADVEPLTADFGFRPGTLLEVGVGRFGKWFCGYHRLVAAGAEKLS